MKTSRHRQFSTFDGPNDSITWESLIAQRRKAQLHDYIARRERDARCVLELYRSRRRDVEFGLDYSWLEKVFNHDGSTFTVVGLLPSLSDDDPPLIVCRSKDRFINFGIEFIKSKLSSTGCSPEAL